MTSNGKETIAYDPVCGRLAEYFLGDETPPEEISSLASTIQQSVEAWFRSRHTTSEAYLLGRSIGTLDLSVRSYNGLTAAGIRTIGELTGYTPRQLAKLRYLGQRSINEIVVILKGIGLELKEEEPLHESHALAKKHAGTR